MKGNDFENFFNNIDSIDVINRIVFAYPSTFTSPARNIGVIASQATTHYPEGVQASTELANSSGMQLFSGHLPICSASSGCPLEGTEFATFGMQHFSGGGNEYWNTALRGSIDFLFSWFINKSFPIFLSKVSFGALLISMFLYWFQAMFQYNHTEHPDALRATEGYADPLHTEGSSPLSKAWGTEGKGMHHFNKGHHKLILGKVANLAMWSANITLVFMLLIRWVESGHFPLSNLYESLLFLSWSLTSMHLFFENALNKENKNGPLTDPRCAYPKGGIRSYPKGKAQLTSRSMQSSLTLGAITSPLSLFTNAFATFSLPHEMQKVTVLVPALQSNWLIMHVSVMIISYAALLSGSLLAMAFLVIQFFQNKKRHINSTIYISEGDTTTAESILAKNSVHLTSLSSPSISEGARSRPTTSTPSASLRTESKESLSKAWVTTAAYPNPEGVGQQTLRIIQDTPSGIQQVSFGASLSSASSAYPEGKPAYPNPEGVDQQASAYPSGQQALNPEGVRSKGAASHQIELSDTLDNLSYRSIGLGFALLTVGILSGAVWANEAWGSYWSWDPKETWAFVTWLVFAFYLHTRLSKGWIGKESAFIATFGFVIVWFCYLGVNIFGKGLHSYGWMR